MENSTENGGSFSQFLFDVFQSICGFFDRADLPLAAHTEQGFPPNMCSVYTCFPSAELQFII